MVEVNVHYEMRQIGHDTRLELSKKSSHYPDLFAAPFTYVRCLLSGDINSRELRSFPGRDDNRCNGTSQPPMALCNLVNWKVANFPFE